MKIVKQAIRGCTNLPHVGSHPGTGAAILFIAMGALPGLGNTQYMLAGACLMAVFIVPLYLCGAVSRANLSDRIANK
jgi:hypothetical protein